MVNLRRPHPHGRRRAQVALLMVLTLVMVVVMTMVTVNIGKVALLKTTTANAADGAALQLASELGSASLSVCRSIRGGDPFPSKCKKCKFGGYFGVALGIFLIVITGGAFAIIAIAGGYFILQSLVFDTQRIHDLNKRLKQLPPKVGLKVAAYLTAFLGSVDDSTATRLQDIDDPRVYKDLSQGVSTGPMTPISNFSIWWDKRLLAVEDQVLAKQKVGNWVTILQGVRDDSQQMLDYLNGDFKPYLDWIIQNYNGRCFLVPDPKATKTNPLLPIKKCRPLIDVPFYHPTLSDKMCINGNVCGPVACSNDDCAASNNACDDPERRLVTDPNTGDEKLVGPPPAGLRPCDEVSFVITDLQGFISFADSILNLSPDEQKQGLGEWVEQLRDYGAVQLGMFSEFVNGFTAAGKPGWLNELKQMESKMPWPPDPALKISLPPPGVPLDAKGFAPCSVFTPGFRGQPGVCLDQHPNGYVAKKVKGFMDKLLQDRITLQNNALVPVEVTLDPKDFIYTWHDAKGYHHIGVEVSDFSFPYPHKVRSWFETCVRGENVGGAVSVKVKRFDEDRSMGLLFTLKQRIDPNTTSPNPADPTEALKAGQVSVANAAYGWQPNSVRISKGSQ